jgi:nucleotide-binding universal stress UspA family protein
MRVQGPVVVALDGSELAEGALPYAVALAKAHGTRLTLLCVWEGNDTELTATLPSVATELASNAHEHFEAYLRGIQARLVDEVPVQASVREGNAADEIIGASDELNASAIAIGTHGRSGIGRWVYGSTASSVLRRATIPVLVAGPEALRNPDAPAAFTHVMTPLDGTEMSEAALPVAREIAARTGARISLVRAVRWAVQSYPYTLPDAYVPQIDDALEKSAKAYLTRKESELGGEGVHAYIVRGAVADGLIDFVDKEGVDLVVMSTHARAGLARAALGSTADRMLQGSAPVLLIRPGAD